MFVLFFYFLFSFFILIPFFFSFDFISLPPYTSIFFHLVYHSVLLTCHLPHCSFPLILLFFPSSTSFSNSSSRFPSFICLPPLLYPFLFSLLFPSAFQNYLIFSLPVLSPLPFFSHTTPYPFITTPFPFVSPNLVG